VIERLVRKDILRIEAGTLDDGGFTAAIAAHLNQAAADGPVSLPRR
jgi:hypothetical protein